jgi:hypothetical protein
MMCSKARSSVRGPGRVPAGFRSGLPLSSRFFAGTAPSLPALLGEDAEAVPSGATSAARYDFAERVFNVSHVVAEREFIDIERQVTLGNLVEGTDDPALQQRPKTLNRLGVDRADNVLFVRVPDHAMRVLHLQPAIADPLVSDQQIHLVGNDLAHEAFEGCGIDAIDDAGDDLAAPADRADDRLLARSQAAATGAAALADMPVLRLAADEGFIDLDNPEQLALGAVAHRHTNAVAHVPGRLVGPGAEHPVDLMGAHALLRVVHQERDLEPLDKRIFGVLEDRPGDDGEPIAVLVAGFADPMERAVLGLPYLGIAAARAGDDAIGPTPLGEERLAIVFGLEPGDKIAELHHAPEYNA